MPEALPVCPAHEQHVSAYLGRTARQQNKFIAAIFISMGTALAPLFIESSFGLAIPLIALGITLVVFPFATPLTVARNGIVPSVKLVRSLGAILLGMGIVFGYLGVVGA